MKSVKFSIISGVAVVLLYLIFDLFIALSLFGLGFISVYSKTNNTSDPVSGFNDIGNFLIEISDKFYLGAFIFGFVIGFPIFYIKKKIDKWVEKNSKYTNEF